MGIVPKNLPNFFTHGFTTWKKEHAFGLHNCALATSEMGGKLTATTPGSNGEAEFILGLPIKPNQRGELHPPMSPMNTDA
ncbi:MAG: hypothetical protein V4710_21555 [Verrucomicrobiota bacterium]